MKTKEAVFGLARLLLAREDDPFRWVQMRVEIDDISAVAGEMLIRRLKEIQG